MERFSSNGLSSGAGTGAAAFSSFFGTNLHQARVVAERAEPFEAELVVGDLGPLRIARLACSPAGIESVATPGPAQARTHMLLFQLRGGSCLRHHGNIIELAAGDVSLCDNGVDWQLVLGAEAELLLLRVPSALLKEHLPSPECFCGRLLSGQGGLCSTAASMALSLLEQLEAGLALHYQARVARHLLDVVGTSYAIAFDTLARSSSIVSGRHATVKLYIEQHLRDPDLTPCLVAARLRLSSRYLRMIFATSNETVSAYILRRRLEECARQIGDASWRGHSLTEIAFSWGFNSAPHFTRSFRDRYAMSPREYRRSKLEGQGGAFRRNAQQSPAPAVAQAA